MIRLIRSDGMEILINTEMIRSVKGGGCTVITLADGTTVTVKNTTDDIAEKVQAYRQGIEAENQAYDESLKPVQAKKAKAEPETKSKPEPAPAPMPQPEETP